MDYLNLDDKSMGMFWVLSHTMTQPACDAIMNWLNSNGITELPMQGSIGQPSERYVLMHETRPLPMSLLSGVSLHLCVRLTAQIEETMFSGQVLLIQKLRSIVIDIERCDNVISMYVNAKRSSP